MRAADSDATCRAPWLRQARGTSAVVGAGTAAVLTLVVSSGRAPVPVGVVLAPAFGGLLSPGTGSGTSQAACVVLALAVLTSCWWVLLSRAAEGRVGLRAVLAVVGAWTAPLLVAPPLLSLDAYAYLAQGAMVLEQLDPYAVGPVVLDDAVVRERVDPFWRASPSPYGPLALALLASAARVSELAGGALEPGVLLLRAAAVVGVAAAVAAVLPLVAPARRPWVLLAVAGNPVVLVHLVGGVHVDAVLAGLCTVALAQLAGGRATAAWWCATAAVAVKLTAAPLLVLVLLALRRSGRSASALATRLAASTLAVGLVALSVVDRPWGFLGALLVPGTAPSWYAPATLAGRLLEWGTHGLLPSGTARAAGAGAVLLAGAALVVRLLLAQAREPVGAATVRRGAVALVVPALSLPALYGWYLGAGLAAWTATASRGGRRLLVLLSSALAFTSLPPLHAAGRGPLALAWCAALAVLGGCAVRHRPWTVRPAAAAEAPALGPLRPAPVAAGVLVTALLGAGVQGSAHADGAQPSRAELADRQRETLLVRQLAGQYPGLRVAGLTALGQARWQVVLAVPGVRACELTVVRPVGPATAFHRVPELVAGRRGRTVEERLCPEPVPPPGTRLRQEQAAR